MNYKLFNFSRIIIYGLIAILAVMNVFGNMMGNPIISKAVTILMLVAFIGFESWNGLLEPEMRTIFIWFLLLILYCIFSSVLGKNYTQMIRALIICMSEVLIGYSMMMCYGENFTTLFRIFCVMMLFSGIYYIIVYMNLGAYGYALKNNYSPMVLFAIIIMTVLVDEIFHYKIVTYALIVFQLFVVFNTKCRSVALTTLILAVIFVLNILVRKMGRYVSKQAFWMTILTVSLVIIFRRQIYDLVYNGLRLAILEESGSEKYSANRLPMIYSGLSLWTQNLQSIIFGATDGSYVECFYIDTLTFRGILGLLCYVGFFSTILKKLFLSTKHDPGNKIILLAILLLVSSLIIAVFEAGAPFVQGSTYFIVWLVVGMALGVVSVTDTFEKN